LDPAPPLPLGECYGDAECKLRHAFARVCAWTTASSRTPCPGSIDATGTVQPYESAMWKIDTIRG